MKIWTSPPAQLEIIMLADISRVLRQQIHYFSFFYFPFDKKCNNLYKITSFS
jgi:hypothetical protein